MSNAEEMAKRLEAFDGDFEGQHVLDDAAALLRSQSATIERLREALANLVDSCEMCFDTRRGELIHLRRLNAARAALEQSS